MSSIDNIDDNAVKASPLKIADARLHLAHARQHLSACTGLFLGDTHRTSGRGRVGGMNGRVTSATGVLLGASGTDTERLHVCRSSSTSSSTSSTTSSSTSFSNATESDEQDAHGSIFGSPFCFLLQLLFVDSTQLRLFFLAGLLELQCSCKASQKAWAVFSFAKKSPTSQHCPVRGCFFTTHFGDDFHQGGSLCILGVCIQVRLQLGRHNLFVFQVSFVSSGLLASSNNHIIVAWCKVTCKWCHDVKTTGDLSFDIASIISSGSQDLVAVLDLQRAVW